MSTTASLNASPEPNPGLLSRLVGVIFSPRDTYAAVARRPRWFGALAVTVTLLAGVNAYLLTTQLGKDLALDQQIRVMEAFGATVTDEAITQMESQQWLAPYTTGAGALFVTPIFMLIYAGILHAVFVMVMGSTGTYRQLYAVLAHSVVLSVLQTVFKVGLTLARGQAAGANLGIFAPGLDETSFALKFLETIDLFYVWSTINLAIGLGVLYKRRTGPIATVFMLLYLVIAVGYAYFTSGS